MVKLEAGRHHTGPDPHDFQLTAQVAFAFRAARVPGRSSSGPLEFRARLEAIVRAGDPLPKISPHDLRHTAGTLMLMRGVPLETVTDTLGHKDSSITRQTCIHITQKFRRDHVIDLFPALPVRVVQKIAVN
jgi:integrase